MNDTLPTRGATERSPWKAVALPAEHGGWGLTLEPVLLGVIVSPSWPGLALGASALLTFLVRTPLKLALVDLRRDRWLPRSARAAWVAGGELAAIAALLAVTVLVGGWAWLAPVAMAMPLVVVELWFDVRSRGRRLVPELCGAVGIGAVVAAIVVVGDDGLRLGVALWMVLGGRAIGAIPFVRVQIMRLRSGHGPTWHSDVAQLVAIGVGLGAVVVEHRVLAGLIGLLCLALVQSWWVRRPPTAPKVLGVRQMALGFGLVAVTAVGVLAG